MEGFTKPDFPEVEYRKKTLTNAFTNAHGILPEDEVRQKVLSETRKQEAQDIENKEVQVLMGQGSAANPKHTSWRHTEQVRVCLKKEIR